MKQIVLLSLFVLTGWAVHADGFDCQSAADDLNLKVYNYVEKEKGTRTAAVMVLSDPEVQRGRRTIARFRNATQTLLSHGALYTALVDSGVDGTTRSGEYVLGTRLGYVDRFVVEVAFNYSQPIQDGTKVPGELTLIKNNGDEIYRDLICTRYLKGSQSL